MAWVHGCSFTAINVAKPTKGCLSECWCKRNLSVCYKVSQKFPEFPNDDCFVSFLRQAKEPLLTLRNSGVCLQTPSFGMTIGADYSDMG